MFANYAGPKVCGGTVTLSLVSNGPRAGPLYLREVAHTVRSPQPRIFITRNS